ncbi:MAG: type II secretion system F family protein [Oligoflexia bacterium]|nr:type II secretion system F family protein [Oligoflexia bacterium]
MREKDRLAALRQQPPGMVAGEEGAKKKKKDRTNELAARTHFDRRLMQAGLDIPAKVYTFIVIFAAVGIFYLGTLLGYLLAVVLSSVFVHYMFRGYLEERAEKRKRQMIPQLAPFIDAIASSLSSGFNIEAAIVASAESIPEGTLRTELDKVISALNRGFSVRESMAVLRDRIVGREIVSLSVALGLFASMGGNVLEPFRRLARKLREQQTVAERASRDLVMVKQAFYILFFLSVSAPGILMLVRPGYMSQAYNDSLGRLVLQVGAVLIVLAYLLFKKITSLKI